MRTLLFAIMMLATSVAFSQTQPQITVSQEKINVNGTVMFMHKVKGGETLYSLAKAYGVTTDDIVRNNEAVKGGLKEGTVIYIPSSGPDVQKKAAITGAQIKKYSKKKHTVKWWETLEDVAAKYGVDPEAVYALNNLSTRQLEKKQVLYIPNALYESEFFARKGQENAAGTENTNSDAVINSDTEGNVSLEENASATENALENNRQYESLAELADKAENKERLNAGIAYILPLNLADSLGANSNFMDFYAGSLLAVNRMKESGMNITVELIDQQMYSSIPAIVSGGKTDRDYIVGPVKSSDMEIFLNKLYGEENRQSGANIISPMDMNSVKLAAEYENFIQVPVSQQTQHQNLLTLFAGKCTEEKNAVIIYEKDSKDAPMVKDAIAFLDSAGIKYTSISYGILEGREIMGKIMSVLNPDKENLVLVPSNSEAFVSDVVRNLNLLYTNPVEENRRNVTLFGMARWRNFERIEIDYFHRMNLHLSLPYFVDYSREDVKDFLMKYRALYNNEPTPFAFQGYDITRFFLSLHSEYAHLFNSAVELDEQQMLQSKFHFMKKSPQSGFENTGTVNIKYNNDYTISVIE